MSRAKKQRNPGGGTVRVFTDTEWRDIHEALLDAASLHHAGPKAARFTALADKIRAEALS